MTTFTVIYVLASEIKNGRLTLDPPTPASPATPSAPGFPGFPFNDMRAAQCYLLQLQELLKYYITTALLLSPKRDLQPVQVGLFCHQIPNEV